MFLKQQARALVNVIIVGEFIYTSFCDAIYIIYIIYISVLYVGTLLRYGRNASSMRQSYSYIPFILGYFSFRIFSLFCHASGSGGF